MFFVSKVWGQIDKLAGERPFVTAILFGVVISGCILLDHRLNIFLGWNTHLMFLLVPLLALFWGYEAGRNIVSWESPLGMFAGSFCFWLVSLLTIYAVDHISGMTIDMGMMIMLIVPTAVIGIIGGYIHACFVLCSRSS